MKNNWRIYLNGRGYRHCRPFLNFLKGEATERAAEMMKQFNGGETLPPQVKKDKNGNPFIFVNDLLPLKGKLIGTNIHNMEKLKLTTWFKNEVVAFGEVNKYLETLKKEEQERIKKYGWGQFWLYDCKNVETHLKKLGLEKWS